MKNRKTRDFIFISLFLSVFLAASGCEMRGIDAADTSAPAADVNSNDLSGGSDAADNTDGSDASDGTDSSVECDQDYECYDDGIGCTQERCVNRRCVAVPRDEECSASASSCVQARCIENVGCVNVTLDNGTPCSVGACSQSAVCSTGVCTGVGLTSCDDHDPCTVDLCDPVAGCSNKVNAGDSCDDGNPFTVKDECNSSGVCAGEAKSLPCQVPADCGTDDLCLSYLCQGGVCVLPFADDSKCNDNVACTVDTCSTSGGCFHKPDMGKCDVHDQLCDVTYGCVECVFDSQCDDSNSCSIDRCEQTTCKHYITFDLDNDGKLDDGETTEKESCDDDNACYTQSFCVAGTCEFGVERVCNDNNANTFDSCEPDFGCLYTPGTPEGSNPQDPPPSGTSEVCGNNVDDDKDGSTDEPGSIGCTGYYIDKDNDTYGKPGVWCLCKPQGDWKVTHDSDCNDDNASIRPNAVEVCNGLNDDCDGQTDEGVCGSGGSGTTESCNGVDDDLDGQVDEEGASGCTTYYYDNDNDGRGAVGSGKCYCAAKLPNSQWKALDSDCNDNNSAVYPGATEVCNNNVDDNCSNSTDEGCSGGGSGSGSGKSCQISLATSGVAVNFSIYGSSYDCGSGGWCPETAPTAARRTTLSVVDGQWVNARCYSSGCGVSGQGYAVAYPQYADVSDIQVINVFDGFTLQADGSYRNPAGTVLRKDIGTNTAPLAANFQVTCP